MKDIPHIQFDAVPLSELNQNSEVLKSSELGFYVWINLPVPYHRQLWFRGLIEEGSEDFVEISDELECQGYTPWLKLKTSVLNLKAGYHKYHMYMEHMPTKEMVDLYFNYWIQDDSPDKPYIYMKR